MMERVKKPKARRMRLSSVANSIRLTKAFSEDEYEMGISALAGRSALHDRGLGHLESEPPR